MSTAQEAREHRAALRRAVDAIEGFLHGWTIAANMGRSAMRSDVLAALSDHDREQFLEIERNTTWPPSTADVERAATRNFLRSKGL